MTVLLNKLELFFRALFYRTFGISYVYVSTLFCQTRTTIDSSFRRRVLAFPWWKYNSTYGRCSAGVPMSLIILSQEGRHWDSVDYLCNELCHQDSTVYEASEHALPFLLELARCKEHPSRLEITQLLSSFAFSTNPHNPGYEPLTDYELRIRQMLIENIPFFRSLEKDDNEELANAARDTIAKLVTQSE
ncbi:MAG: hypothetical protein AAF497_26395 [Planctomycetota bacterium]